MAVSTEDARNHEFANSVPDRDSVFFKFDDAEFARSHRRVCAVALYGGRVLDGFQFFYDDQVPGYHRGGTGGSRTLFTLAAGEVITEVRGSTGTDPFASAYPTLGELTLVTNRGRKCSVGMGSGFSQQTPFCYRATPGCGILALKGACFGVSDGLLVTGLQVSLEAQA